MSEPGFIYKAASPAWQTEVVGQKCVGWEDYEVACPPQPPSLPSPPSTGGFLGGGGGTSSPPSLYDLPGQWVENKDAWDNPTGTSSYVPTIPPGYSSIAFSY